MTADPQNDCEQEQDTPLRLLPFEEYYLRDESDAYPMVFPYAYRFRGSVDRERFDQAYDETLLNEPLLRSRVVKDRGRLFWRLCNERPAVEWRDVSPDHDSELLLSTRRIDIRNEPAHRLAVEVGDNTVTVIGYFHHACADGLSVNRFLANLLARYGQLIGDGEGLQYAPPRPELIADRGNLGITPPEPISFWRVLQGMSVEIFRWAARRPTRLSTTPPLDCNDPPAMIWRGIGEEVVTGLKRAAHDHGVTANDVLLCESIRLAESWNRRAGDAGKGWFRVLAPTNLRRPQHRLTPACNILGYAFVTRRARDCQDGEALLRGISEEMRVVRYWNLGTMFLTGLRFVQKTPFAMAAVTNPRLCHATTTVSNMGPFQAGLPHRRFRRSGAIEVGDLHLEEIVGAPPVRPNTPITFAVTRTRGRMNLCAMVDRKTLPLQQATELLDRYVERITAFADQQAGSVDTPEPATC